MSNLKNSMNQGIASYINTVNIIRLEAFSNKIQAILQDQNIEISEHLMKESNALKEINLSEVDIQKYIQTNRGGDKGIHGFIAESAEVGIQNSKRALLGLDKVAVHLNDNGPADIILNQEPVQMKFYQDFFVAIRQSESYRDMKMMFSKDQVDTIDKIMQGDRYVEFNGQILSSGKTESIRKAVNDESKFRGQTYKEWMLASELDYSEVQRETIHKTLDAQKTNIKDTSKENIKESKEKYENKKREASLQAAPSFTEAAKVAAIGGLVQSSLEFGLFIFKKQKEGRNIWEFNQEEWVECGLVSAKGATKGAATSASIYSLTNFVGLPAPAASALVSATSGIYNASELFRNDEIDTEEFMNLVMFASIDSAASAFGAAIGQTVIPIPILGSVIGSIVATTALNIGTGILNDYELNLLKKYKSNIEDYVDNLNETYLVSYKKLIEKYNQINDIQDYLLSVNVNVELQFMTSIQLAELVGIDEEDILYTTKDIDDYFLH